MGGLKPQDKTQITMIVIWVVELFMNQMGALRSNETSYLQNPRFIELQKQFDSFLATEKVEVGSFVMNMIVVLFLLSMVIFYIFCEAMRS